MGDTIRVLHVDDEPDLTDLTATYLKREDERFRFETAISAEEGFERLSEESFDCIISDFSMPGLNGIEFLESVREEHPDLPFILFTGRGSEDVASEAISKGVTDYLQKGTGSDQYTVLANRIVNAVERWRAERKADQTRTQLEAITENSSDAIVTIDQNSIIQFANKSVEDLAGYTPSALEGESVTMLMSPRYRDDHRAAVNRYLETGERTLDWQAVEFPILHREGHEVPVSISYGKFTQHGEQYFVGIMRDISERERIEERLLESEQRFRQLAENIQEVVWMTDAEKEEMIYVNPAYEDIWERSVESLYENPESFFEAIHPDDRDRVREKMNEQVTGDYDEQYRISLPDGEVRWIHERAVPVQNDSGDVYRIVGIASDITEQRSREQDLERVGDLFTQTERIADVGGWEIDTDTMAVFWTENLFELLGVDHDEEPPLDEALDVYHKEDRPIVENAVETALTSGEPFDIEVRYRRPGGEVRWLRVQGIPTVENGEIMKLRGAVQDITERKTYERKLENQNARLKEFASVVSHDLRNPLNLAQGRLELAKEECDSAHLENIDRDLNRSQTLIDDLLSLAREGEEVGTVESVDLTKLAKDCWNSIKSEEATLNLETNRPIKADRSRLQQLLENLIRNSIEQGTSQVTVTIGELEDGFFVEDDGPGISQEEGNKVFESGYSTSEEGTGFGLSIVKQIAEAHHWDVHLSSGEDGGARFQFTNVKFGGMKMRTEARRYNKWTLSIPEICD